MSDVHLPRRAQSQSEDYCDVCGLPIQGAGGGSAARPPARPRTPRRAYRRRCRPAAHPLCPRRGILRRGAPGVRPVAGCTGDGDPHLPELLDRQPRRRALLRELRLRLHHRAAAASDRPARPGGRAAGPTSGDAGRDGGVGRGGLDRPRLVHRPRGHRPPALRRCPAVVPLAERTVLVGRTSTSRNIHPQIDCSADSGVSRRHAQLSTDGQRWWVEDLQSSNGTYVGGAGEPLPEHPGATGPARGAGRRRPGLRGAWTRIVVRKAAPGELS